MVPTRTARALWGVLLTLALLALGGCGVFGDDRPTMTRPTDRPAARLAADLVAAATRAKTVHYTEETSTGSDPSAAPERAEGSARIGEPAAMEVTLSTATGRTRLIVVGDRAYANTDDLPPEMWLATPASASLGAADVLGPLVRLKKAATAVAYRGIEVTDGAPTGHYTFTVDLAAYGAVPAGTSGTSATATVDVWVDDADLVRRVSIGPKERPLRVQTFSRWGLPVDIAAPPAADVIRG